MRAAIILGIMVSLGSAARAQVVASDDFGYSGALTANGWTAHSGAGNKVILANSSFATLNQSSGSGEDVSLVFPAFGATDTIHASFVLHVPSGTPVNPGTNGLYFAHFKNDLTFFHGRVGLLSPTSGGDFRLAVSDTSNLSTGAIWATELAFDTDYKLVVSWNAATGENRLWLDPADMTSTNVSVFGTFTGDLMSAFALRQASDYTGFLFVDDVVVGHTFADVCAPADTTAPVLTCPSEITVIDAKGGTPGQAVFFTVTAVDDTDPAPSVVCVPASGSLFPRGTTVVTCTATDASGNSSVCTFPVTVQATVRPRKL